MPFSIETLKKLFPYGEVNYFHDRNEDGTHYRNFEVNELKAGTVPQNCVILDAVDTQVRGKRYQFYLVRIDDYDVSFRICAAGSDSAYDEFATSTHGWECYKDGNHLYEDWFMHQSKLMYSRKEDLTSGRTVL